ncbi:hypothetical protein THAOC_27137, partial [Thalassiosira oceanica]
GADRTEVHLWPLMPLTVQLLVLDLCRTLLACLLVQLAVGPLAVHAAVLDEAARRAVLELDAVAPLLAAVGAGFATAALAVDGLAVHHGGPRPRLGEGLPLGEARAKKVRTTGWTDGRAGEQHTLFGALGTLTRRRAEKKAEKKQKSVSLCLSVWIACCLLLPRHPAETPSVGR